MYGYLRTYNDELKLKNIKLYKKYYCVLCTRLGECVGLKYRMLTSYDVTLFLIIFDLISNDKDEIFIKCPTRIKKQTFEISQYALEYSVFISLLQFRKKLDDDYIDEKKHKILRFLVKHNKKINQLLSDEFADEIDDVISEYYKIENNENASFDEVINCISKVYGLIFKEYSIRVKYTGSISNIYRLGECIGKYVYLIDAYDDYFNDYKNNQFNPFFKLSKSEDLIIFKEKIEDRMKFIIEMIVVNLIDILNDEFEISDDRTIIIKNIVGYGVFNNFKNITKKIYSNKK